MNEQEIRKSIKIGLKTPSTDFTDKVMCDITSLENEVQTENKWTYRILILACCLLPILSVFVSFPKIYFFNFSIGFSPVIMPIISLAFIFIALQQLYDLRKNIMGDRKPNIELTTKGNNPQLSI